MTTLPPGTLPAPPTTPTGSSLQRLADEAWERDAGRSELYFEGSRWTGDASGSARSRYRWSRWDAPGPASPESRVLP
jgi:hypothetical protein